MNPGRRVIRSVVTREKW